MMMFKFDIKRVRLNFKAIASIEFNFDLKLDLLCSYDVSWFMKTIESERLCVMRLRIFYN